MFCFVDIRTRADRSPTTTSRAPASYMRLTTARTTSGFVVVGFRLAATMLGFRSTVFPLMPILSRPPSSLSASATMAFASEPPTADTLPSP